jgi:hypothetical protein
LCECELNDYARRLAKIGDSLCDGSATALGAKYAQLWTYFGDIRNSLRRRP